MLQTWPCAAAIGAVAAFTSPAQAITISPTNSNAFSGAGNFGQEIRLDFTEAAFTADTSYDLESFTLFKGGAGGGGSTTLFLDVYQADTAAETTPNFSGGTPSTTGLTYLGSSDNSFDSTPATAVGTPLAFAFSGISLLADRDVYLVGSSNDEAGSFVGSSFNIVNAGGRPVYTNIDNADSDPLFGGLGDPDPQDNRYSAEVVVPEPASLALLGLGGLALMGRRRR